MTLSEDEKTIFALVEALQTISTRRCKRFSKTVKKNRETAAAALAAYYTKLGPSGPKLDANVTVSP